MSDDNRNTHAVHLTTDEIIELGKAIGISIDVKSRRLAKLDPKYSNGYRNEVDQFETMQSARDALTDALSDALEASAA